MTWLIRLNTMSHDSLEEIFSFVVKVAAHMDDNGGNAYELFEICSAEGLANEFIDMFKRDVLRRVKEEGE
ncbi:hypothetical protein HanOQP8_Chr02g0053171 [Helianthus annuus]|nr:hypothetical protein HanOQP8_Chr02g0053171 [Helianthus annuus]